MNWPPFGGAGRTKESLRAALTRSGAAWRRPKVAAGAIGDAANFARLPGSPNAASVNASGVEEAEHRVSPTVHKHSRPDRARAETEPAQDEAEGADERNQRPPLSRSD
jgi:hypothetical protein